jgi:hypothetical protein
MYEQMAAQLNAQLKPLMTLIDDYYAAALMGAALDDPSFSEEQDYNERMRGLRERTEKLLNLKQEAEAMYVESLQQESRPQIICLCGSTRFGETFRAANLQETLAGRIVLSIGCEWHSDQTLGLTAVDKQQLDELHLRKIDLADVVYVLNVGGYVGSSTRREIEYARAQGKVIRWLEAPSHGE